MKRNDTMKSRIFLLYTTCNCLLYCCTTVYMCSCSLYTIFAHEKKIQNCTLLCGFCTRLVKTRISSCIGCNDEESCLLIMRLIMLFYLRDSFFWIPQPSRFVITIKKKFFLPSTVLRWTYGLSTIANGTPIMSSEIYILLPDPVSIVVNAWSFCLNYHIRIDYRCGNSIKINKFLNTSKCHESCYLPFPQHTLNSCVFYVITHGPVNCFK